MSVITIANAFYDFLTTQLPTIKASFTKTSVTGLGLFRSLDPVTQLETQGKTGVYVVPLTNEYVLADSNRRQKVKSLTRKPRVAIFIYINSTNTTDTDIADWTEVSEFLNFREAVEKALITNDWAVNISEVVAEPPMETSLKKGSFIAVTEFEFEEQTC